MSINGTIVTRTYEVGGLSGKSAVTMDMGQAMSLLGFPSNQTFESTSMEDINSAFTYRMHLVVKANMGPKRTINARKIESRKNEMRKLNEALQFLTRKRARLDAMEGWKIGMRKSYVVSQALEALVLDDGTLKRNLEAKKDDILAQEIESKKVLAVAEALTTDLQDEKTGSLVRISSGKGRRKSRPSLELMEPPNIKTRSSSLATHSLGFDTRPTFGSTKSTRRASLAVPTKHYGLGSSTRRYSYVSTVTKSATDLTGDLDLNGLKDVKAGLIKYGIKLSPMEDKHVKFSDE